MCAPLLQPELRRSAATRQHVKDQKGIRPPTGSRLTAITDP